MKVISNNSLRSLLDHGLEQLCLTVEEQARNQLVDYLQLLSKWNRAYNLTAIRDPQDMVIKHLLDSLSILPWVRGPDLLDVGTGAGIPGIPLAVCKPDIQWTLLDSNGKKTRFLIQTISDLGIENIKVVKSRIESYQQKAPHQIVCRAFSSIRDFYSNVHHLVADHTELLAMKGPNTESEIEDLAQVCEIKQVIPLQVPLLDEERNLVILSKMKTEPLRS